MEGYMDGIINSVMERMKSIPLLISDDDLEINVDKWKSGEIKDLYILGLSGSGKSTLSREFHRKYRDCSLIELDAFLNSKYHSEERNDGTLLAYAKKYYGNLKTFSNYITLLMGENNLSDKELNIVIDEEFLKYIRFCHYEWKKRCIIEGVDVICAVRYGQNDIFKENEYALIIKGTSVTKSFIQKFKRDGGFNENGFKPSEIVEYLAHYYKRYNDWRDGINHVIDDLT